MRTPVLDHGYVEYIQHWGDEEQIIEAARMSTGKGFEGWGPTHKENCPAKNDSNKLWDHCICSHPLGEPGDEKLLRYLWVNKHHTPFEMAGVTIEVKAPIFVFREWHRHRTQSYNEMSARYTPLPNENYVPTIDRFLLTSKTNKQAGAVKGADKLAEANADTFIKLLEDVYRDIQRIYEWGLQTGIPKELARLCIPVGRYSRMRASANLRNWLGFLTLRADSHAQWEIQQYAYAVCCIIAEHFPQTYKLWLENKDV